MTSRRKPTLNAVQRLAGRFAVRSQVTSAEEMLAGHINDSYVITTTERSRFLLQRMNAYVFPRPDVVMSNLERVLNHLAGLADTRSRRRRLTLVPTRNGASWVECRADDEAPGAWRMVEMIEDVVTALRASSAEQAFAAAHAFGRFEAQLTDLPPPPLQETIPGFHDTPARFEALDAALRRASDGSNPEVAERRRQAAAEIEEATSRRGLARRLVDASARGLLPRRTVHNDCKISNVLFDRRTDEALCVVDLDTTMPGLVAFDFGDMVRSMGHHADEDDRDPESAEVDLELFRALAAGYLEGAHFVDDDERRSLVDGALVLTLEQAVRFLADHLCGDVYFRVERPGQNLERCRVQLRLLRSLVAHERELRRIVG